MTFLWMILEFFKTGAFAIGGGLATIPFLKEMSTNYGWFTITELMDFIAISESTPGPIGINMATYAGFKTISNEYDSGLMGVIGGIITPIALVIPSVLAVLFVAKFYEKFKTNKYIEASFAGVRASTPGLICGAMGGTFLTLVWSAETWKNSIFDGKWQTWLENAFNAVNKVETITFLIFVFCIMKFKKLHPIVYIAAGAVVGIAFKL